MITFDFTQEATYFEMYTLWSVGVLTLSLIVNLFGGTWEEIKTSLIFSLVVPFILLLVNLGVHRYA